MWTLLAGFKNALRYGLVGDHVDAHEALRIGLINKVVAVDELLEECFKIVERIAHVPPETVKINLQISTMKHCASAWSSKSCPPTNCSMSASTLSKGSPRCRPKP